jgi:hypothetical protein
MYTLWHCMSRHYTSRQESNNQFDSWPLKVRNHPDLLMCRWHGTYHWKNINKGYNFALDLTSIEGMHKKLWASKVAGVPISGISRFPTQEPRDKMTFGCIVRGHAQRILLGGRWWLPSSLGWGESCESVFVCDSSMHQKCSNYTLTNLLFSLCRSVWIIDSLVTCCNPHLKVPTCPFALEMLRAKEHAPIPYPSIIFHFGTHNWVYQGVWGPSLLMKMTIENPSNEKVKVIFDLLCDMYVMLGLVAIFFLF